MNVQRKHGGRYLQDVAKRLLGDKGLAISVTPASAKLDPFGEARFLIRCVNNMCGEYTDVLHCMVGHLPDQEVLVRAGVIGTPVHVQLEGNFIRGLHSQIVHATRLGFGEVPRSVGSTKHFHMFNTSCFDVDVDLRVWVFESDLQKDWVTVSLVVSNDDTVAVNIRYAFEQ